MSVHPCRAIGCSVLVRESMLMCRAHWALVPRTLQVRVWTAYRREHLGREYLAAIDAAIQAVSQRENRETN